MPKSHPGIDSITKYLKFKFAWKEDWYCEKLDQTFTYLEVKEALRRFKKTDPKLHRYLSYRWMSHRSRSDIASSLYIDNSTLKRLTLI